MEKYIYPNVLVRLYYIQPVPIRLRLIIETYLRKKYRNKYYLQKIFSESDILDDDNKDAEILTELNRFHSNVYKSIILGKVDLKLIFPDHYGRNRNMFELDTDQRSEEKRLTPNI